MTTNRKIKFRAWDKQTGKMMFVENLYLEDDYVTLYTGNINDGKTIKRKNCDVILMQCTGLKDKSGVEIYEGDIIEHSWHGISSVFRKNGSWKINGRCSAVGFGTFAKKTEVIGNIHQNPELLSSSSINEKQSNIINTML